MGCCTSVAKSGRPIKASIIQNTSRAELLEEEKNPDLYRQSSAMQGSQILPEVNPLPMKLLDPSPPKIPSKAPSRQASEFSLNKDLIESMRKERTISMSMALENGGQIDESIYKLSKEQHKMIYEFVEERTKIMKEDINKLNAHLCAHDNEVEELALIIEDLRTSEKDIANCVEDLRTFSVRNEQEYYKRLEKDGQFTKDLITEYRTYQNGLCDFQTMKSAIIKLLRANNIQHVDKPDPAETSIIEPLFQPPVENAQETTKEEIKKAPETPKTFQITTVFEEVEGQPIEPKPTNNDLEPIPEAKHPEEISPLPFKIAPRRLVLDGKVILDKTVDETESSGLKSNSNYLVHHGSELIRGIQDESPQMKTLAQVPVQVQGEESPQKKYIDLNDVMKQSGDLKAGTEQKVSARKPPIDPKKSPIDTKKPLPDAKKAPLDAKVKRVRKVRAPTKRKEEDAEEIDFMDSRSDLESIGVDLRDPDLESDNMSVMSIRSRKAAEVYNIDFTTTNLQEQIATNRNKQIAKKPSRGQINEKPKVTKVTKGKI